MAFNQYQYNKEKLAKLPFLGLFYKYLYWSSARNIIWGELYGMKSEDYKKAKARLVGGEGEIVSGDKVYLFPHSSIPLFKLKDHLKTVGAKFTTDISEATKMIGHANVSNSYDQHTNSSFLREFTYPCLMSDREMYDVPSWTWTNEEKKMHGVQAIIDYRLGKDVVLAATKEDKEYVDTICSDLLMRNLNIRGRRFNPLYTITTTGALILHQILANKVLVINEDAVFKSIGKPLIIDEDTFASLEEMLDSEDRSQHKIAAEILSNSDIEHSWFYLWKIARNYFYEVNAFKAYKNVNLFIDKARLRQLASVASEDMIPYLKARDQLTPENFKTLADQAVKDFSSRHHSSVFKLSLVPAEMYADVAGGASFMIDAEGVNKMVEESTTDDEEVMEDDD